MLIIGGETQQSNQMSGIDECLHLTSLLAYRSRWTDREYIGALCAAIDKLPDIRLECLPESQKIALALVLNTFIQQHPKDYMQPLIIQTRVIGAMNEANRSIMSGNVVQMKPLADRILLGFDTVTLSMSQIERDALATTLHHVVTMCQVTTAEPNLSKEDGLKVAFNVASGAEYPKDVEVYEDQNLRRLKDALEQDLYIQTEKENWSVYAQNPDLYEGKILALANRIIALQTSVMGGTAPDKVEAYRISRQDCRQEMAAAGRNKFAYPLAVFLGQGTGAQPHKVYRGIDVSNKPTIGINLHRDALSLTEHDYYAFESLVIHEQTHRHQQLMMDGEQLAPAHPMRGLTECFQQASILGKTWEQDDVYGWSFYRLTPRERHAFTLQRKIYALRIGHEIPSERQILMHDLVRKEQGYEGFDFEILPEDEVSLERYREMYPKITSERPEMVIPLSEQLRPSL